MFCAWGGPPGGQVAQVAQVLGVCVCARERHNLTQNPSRGMFQMGGRDDGPLIERQEWTESGTWPIGRNGRGSGRNNGCQRFAVSAPCGKPRTAEERTSCPMRHDPFMSSEGRGEVVGSSFGGKRPLGVNARRKTRQSSSRRCIISDKCPCKSSTVVSGSSTGRIASFSFM